MKMDSKHVNIIRSILNRYPYGFYSFRLPVQGKSFEFSDPELCFFEDIPSHTLSLIEQDLGKSGLPYKVDLIDWHKADDELQKGILKYMLCFKNSEAMIRVAQNSISHFLYFPKLLKMKASQYNKLNIINTGLESPTFNIAYGAANNEDIIHILDQFQRKPFTWWVPPHLISQSLHTQLVDHNFSAKIEYALICDLDKIERIEQESYGMKIDQVLDAKRLEDFISIVEPYDKSAREFYGKLTPDILKQQQKLYIGYQDGVEPCAVGMLFCNQSNSSGSIFGVFLKEDKRGKGFGKDIVTHLMREAKNLKLRYVTLNSSSDAYNIYESLNFRAIGKFDCFEWKKKH